MMKTAALLSMGFVMASAGGIEFSRKVESVMSGASGNVTLSPGCSSSDQYGSKSCSLKWGEKVTLYLNASLPVALGNGSKFKVESKVEDIFKLDFTCVLCGGTCEFEVPVAKKKVKIHMPACPLVAAGPVVNVTSFELPKKSPSPVSAKIKGTATVYDDDSKEVAKISFDGKIEK